MTDKFITPEKYAMNSFYDGEQASAYVCKGVGDNEENEHVEKLQLKAPPLVQTALESYCHLSLRSRLFLLFLTVLSFTPGVLGIPVTSGNWLVPGFSGVVQQSLPGYPLISELFKRDSFESASLGTDEIDSDTQDNSNTTTPPPSQNIQSTRTSSLHTGLFSSSSFAPASSTAPASLPSQPTIPAVIPTNDTTSFSADFDIIISSSSIGLSWSAQLSALTSSSGKSTVVNGLETICSGRLVNVSNGSSIAWPDIALMSCDNGLLTSQALLNVGSENPGCIVLYSLTGNACNLSSSDPELQTSRLGLVMTTFSISASASIFNGMQQFGNLTASVSPASASATTSSTPSGKSSSTVTMAVLYSITGVIAGLFLFVIISGAVRVHKHPERYGLVSIGTSTPGGPAGPSLGADPFYTNHARGIARAVLDSIPLVRVKPKDIRSDPQCDNASTDITPHSSISASIQSFSTAKSTQQPAKEIPISSLPDQRSPSTPRAFGELSDNPNSPRSSIDPSYDCPICFETFDTGQILRALPCGHKFHAACVDRWLLNSSTQCPLCRTDLSNENGELTRASPISGESDNGAGTQPGSNMVPDPSAASVVIPPGYDINTTLFDRFLDVWNAHLLPREARRAALTRFHEETRLRRLVREQERGSRTRWFRWL